MANQLHYARAAKDDEFYTQYHDVEKAMNAYYEYDNEVFKDKIILLPCDDPEWSNFTKYFAANFERLGLKKLISTSYAKGAANRQITLFEEISPLFNIEKHETRGRIFILEKDVNNSGKIDIDDLEWDYLEGDGDFRSEEVTKLRDEADIIITNEPFSLFREFLAWIIEGNKKFAIVANQNVYTYKEVFHLIKENKIWVGTHSGDMAFRVPEDSEPRATRYWEDETGQKWRSLGNATWLTNLEHGKRHEKLQLMTMEDNLKYNKKLSKKLMGDYGENKYHQYDNYNAIEVPIVEAIPSDYDGLMGVPVTFLDKYCPEQFEIIWTTDRGGDGNLEDIKVKTATRFDAPTVLGKGIYKRIIIKRKDSN